MLPQEPSEPDGTSALADRDQLERGLRRPTVPQRTILVLHFYVRLTPSEAADALEIPVGTAGERGYVILLYTSGDEPAVAAAYGEEFFTGLLATLQLQPEDTVDTPASASPSAS